MTAVDGGAARGGRRRVTVLSPHFDDVPLSLGESLRSGALSRCDVDVRVVFGRTSWTTWVHPTEARAVPVGWWRRIEESLAAASFGYRYRAAGWSEALLRWGDLDPERLLDPAADLVDEPLVGEVAGWVEAVVRGAEGPPDLLLAPAGLGGHVDHRIVALAAAGALVVGDGPARGEVPLGFYEDRPYVSHLDDVERDRQLEGLGVRTEPLDVSGPVRASTQRRVRRCYPSQMDGYFREAMRRDLERRSVERVWFPPGSTPRWLR